MKPLELVLNNIGPFRHETIDFTQLGDMFLVCGKTGAGKSTIFNSITYALYGKLPGERSKVTGNELRSDYVASHEEASITFTFLHHQSCYKIHRILPSIHLTKKNTETKQAESVELYKKNHSTFELLQNKKSETDKALESLMGLTVEEFSRIILLPQGEFAEFLKQNSKEKRETLLKLFPLDQYENLIKTIKDKADAEKAKLKAIELQLVPFGDFNEEKQKEKIKEYEDILENNSQKQNDLKEKLHLTELEITTLKKNLQEFDSYHTICHNLNLHLQSEQEIAAQEEQITRAIQATPAYLKIKELEKITQSFETIVQQLTSTKKQIVNLTAEAKELEEQKDYFQKLKETYSKNTTLLHDLNNGISLQKELDQLLSLEAKTQNKIAELEQQQHLLDKEKNDLQGKLNSMEPFSPQELQELNQKITENKTTIQQINFTIKEFHRYNELDSTIKQKEKNIQEAVSNSNTLKAQYLEKKKLLETAKEQNYSKHLAETLKNGTPCPVCGSTHHPIPANLATNQNNFTEFDFTYEQNKLDELETELNNLILNISKEEGSLKELIQQLNLIQLTSTEEELLCNLSNITKENLFLEEKITLLNKNSQLQQEIQSKLNHNIESQAPLQSKINQLNQESASRTGIIQEKKQFLTKYIQTAHEYGFPAQSILTIHTDVNDWLTTAQSSLTQYEDKITSNNQNLTATNSRFQQQTELLTTYQKDLQFAEDDLNQLLSESSFTCQQQVLNAYLDQTSIQNLQIKINEWNNLRIKLETQKLQIEKNLTGTQEETRTKLIQLEQQQETITNEITSLDSTYKLALKESEQIKNTLENWLNLESQRQKLQTSEALINQLYTDISDKNPKKIAITTWILGVYLDQVVSCANSRLKRISEGRYTLHFSKDKSGNGAKGLDLEVLDSYTGKNRPCATLSGGETFMVSISLALALTDVVTSKRGGISLQSLFIDEGFGSLDPTSLDKALSILEEVREGRCVGIISHVSEMQNRIPSRLEVIKTSTGSTVRLIGD